MQLTDEQREQMRRAGISEALVKQRIKRLGMTVDEAVSTPKLSPSAAARRSKERSGWNNGPHCETRGAFDSWRRFRKGAQ